MTRRVIADRYWLGDLIGSGGMGKVWLAHDELLHRSVAVKEVVLPEGLEEDEFDELNLRTLREARTAARLTHPGVVRVYDVVFTGGRPWIIMEYVPSRSLAQVIMENGPLSPQQTAQVGLALLDALGAAHLVGVLHRDVKPGNVLLADDDRIMLTDFGLATFDEVGATLTQSGVVHGSPQFISPERAFDGTSTPASDMWSLGATLYAAVEGRVPYARATAYETLAALATDPPDPVELAGELTPVLLGLLARHPVDRMRTVAVRARLRRIVSGEDGDEPAPPLRIPAPEEIEPVAEETPGSVPPPAGHRLVRTREHGATSSRHRHVGRSRRTGPPAWMVAASILIVLLALAGLMLWQSVSAEGAKATGGDAHTAGPVGGVPVGSAAPAGLAGSPKWQGSGRPRAFAPLPDGKAWLCPPTAGPPTASPNPRGGPPPVSPPSGPAQPTSGPGGGADQAPAEPTKWATYRSPVGLTAEVPVGWLAVPVEPVRQCLYARSSSRYATITTWHSSSGDPVKDLGAHEAELHGAFALPDYHRIGSIVSIPCQSTCAAWDYMFDGPGGPIEAHTMEYTAPHHARYAVTWAAPQTVWPADEQSSLNEFVGTVSLPD